MWVILVNETSNLNVVEKNDCWSNDFASNFLRVNSSSAFPLFLFSFHSFGLVLVVVVLIVRWFLSENYVPQSVTSICIEK